MVPSTRYVREKDEIMWYKAVYIMRNKKISYNFCNLQNAYANKHNSLESAKGWWWW